MVHVDERGPVGDPRLLQPDIGRLDSKGFTRNGDFFYFKNVGGPDVYLAEIDAPSGRVIRPPTPLKERSDDGRMWASWSPDGEHLAYRPLGARPIVAIHDVNTNVVRRVPLEMNYLGPLPNWTTNGLLVSGLDRLARAGIYRVDPATGAVAPVVPGTHGLNARFSPDAKLLFYVQFDQQPHTRALMVRDMDKGETRELFRGDIAPAFALSPDGQSVAIRVLTESTRAVLVISVANGVSRVVLPLASEDAGAGLAWTADGSALLLVRGKENGELWRVPVGGGQPEQLDLKLPGMLTISVNPDGRRLAIVATQQTPEVWVLQNLSAARDSR